MNRTAPGLVLATCLFAWAPAAHAAPTCQSRSGQTVRCDVSEAMPVGWTLPDDQRALSPTRASPNSLRDAFPGFLLVACFIAMFALLPDFDGTKDSDWEPKQDDKRKPK